MNIQKIFRYWIHDTAIGLLNITIHHALRLLPIDACSAFGAFVTPLSVRRYTANDLRARRNWRRLHPQSDPASTDAAMKRLWHSISRSMAEFSVLDRIWNDGRVGVNGIEFLDAVRDAGKPILVACVHLGNWEIIPIVGIRMGHPGSGIYLPLENRFDTRIAVKGRERYGAILVPGDGPGAMRAAIKALIRKAGPFVVFIDEYTNGRVLAPAFGRPLRPEGNMAYVARLAVMTGAEIIPAYCLRLGDRARFQVNFLAPVPLVRGRDDTALMANIVTLNSIIEPLVREHFDQWYFALDFDFDH